MWRDEDEALDEQDYYKMPGSWDDDLCRKMLGKTLKDRLVIAGALIAAEIDRLNALQDVA